MKDKYSCSLVYQKQELGSITNVLRVIILDASSEDEALGLSINKIESSLKDEGKNGFSLLMKVIIKIIPQPPTS